MGKIAKKIAGLSPAVKRAYLCNLDKLLTTGYLEKYYQHLIDFDFMSTKISHSDFGVQALIEDYDLIDSVEELNYADHPEKIRMLKLIQEALRLSAHILGEEPSQLASQLWGRLGSFEMPELRSLLQQVEQNQTVWLHPLKASLMPPGGRLIRTLSVHKSVVTVVTITTDGKQMVSGSGDGAIRVWDLETEKVVTNLIGHQDAVSAITVTPDNKQVVSGAKDGTLKVWNLAEDHKPLTLAQNQPYAQALTISSDGKCVFVVNSFEVQKWNLETKKSKVLLTLKNKSQNSDLIEVTNIVTLTHDGTIAILYLSIQETIEENVPIPNGMCIVTFANYKTRRVIHKTALRIVDLETDRGFNIRFGHDHSHITTITVTPDGKQAICGLLNGHIEVWNLKTRQKQFTLKGHSDEIVAITVASNNKQAISSSKDEMLKVWNLEIGREISALGREISALGREISAINSFSDLVTSIVITPNCKHAILATRSSLLKTWILEEIPYSFNTLDYNLKTKNIEIKNKKSNKLFSTFPLPVLSIILDLFLAIFFGYPLFGGMFYYFTNTITHLSFINAYLTFVLVYFLLFYSAVKVASFRSLYFSHIQQFNKLSFFSFLWLIPIAFISKIITNKKPADNHNIFNNKTSNFFVIKNTNWMISTLNNEIIKTWNLKAIKQLSVLTTYQDNITCLAVTPNNKYLISAYYGKIIKVWELKNLNKMFDLKSPSIIVYDSFATILCTILTILEVWVVINFSLDFSYPFLLSPFLLLLLSYPYYLFLGLPDDINFDFTSAIAITSDSKKVICGSRDATINIWDIKSRRQLFILNGHVRTITSVAVTSDSRCLVSGSKDKTLKVWNLETGKEFFTLTGHSSAVTAVAVIPDGSRAISGSSDGQIIIWDLLTPVAIAILNGHRDSVEAISLTKDGKHFVSAASDCKLKVWDLLTGREKASFTADSPLTSCVFTSNRRIVAGDQTGQLHFLRLENI